LLPKIDIVKAVINNNSYEYYNKKTFVLYKGYKLKCSIGKSGIILSKKEGDLATPKGIFKLGLLYYRKDRNKSLVSKIKKRVIKKNMGWCNDSRSKKYNQEIYFPFKYGAEKLYIKDTMRPILGINDLCRAITSIVEFDEDKRGLYNLASFNKTAEQIAYEVAGVMGVEVKEYEADPTQVKNVKSQTKAYNFSISTLKFRKEFKFKFQDTVESLAMGLKESWDSMTKTDRSEAFYYE